MCNRDIKYNINIIINFREQRWINKIKKLRLACF